MRRPAGIAAGTLLILAHFAAAVRAQAVPSPTPRLYVTHNHGVAIRIPPGLSYCPLPDGWVGSDHGTLLYIVPPAACPPVAEAEHASSAFIGVYYGFNVAEYARADGTQGPPRSAAELLHLTCPAPRSLPGVILLGRPALLCHSAKGPVVTIASGALFYLEPPAPGRYVQGRALNITLATTRPRLHRDFRLFARLLAQVSICTPEWARRTSGRAACPTRATWW